MMTPTNLRRSRRTALSAALATTLALLLAAPTPAQTVSQRKPTLEERLVAGLKVRRPSEFEYVEAVVDTVNRGELPVKVVDRLFFWARGRAPQTSEGRRPIIYFQAGLTRVAAKMKVEIKADPTSTG